MSFSLNVPHERLALNGLLLDGFTPVIREGEHEERIQRLVKNLSRSLNGEMDRSIITLVLRDWGDTDLTLVERAISELEIQQQRYDFTNADAIHFMNKGKPLKRNSNIGLNVRGNRAGRPPFAAIVDSVIPNFNEDHLLVLINFGTMHDDLDTLVHLSDVLRGEGVNVTRETMERHLHALIRVKTVRRMRRDVWVSESELVRVVEMFPDSSQQIMQVLLERGSLDALEEIMTSTPALAEGAL